LTGSCPARRLGRLAAAILAVVVGTATLAAQDAPVSYRVSILDPAHHWLEVEATFTGLDAAPFRARISRASPGRYSVHEFAKNVFSLEAFDGAGRPLRVSRTGADEWQVADHGGTVRLVYRVFGDQVDGTYLGVDTTHAHVNMPAAFIWGVGLDLRPIQVTFVPPAGSNWRAATQLFPTAEPLTFTAPNLQYFMDSPTELSDFRVSQFTVAAADGSEARFRVVAHVGGTQAGFDALVTAIRRLVREEMAVFGVFPQYEPGEYTFLLDYVPWADGDGMEHRNSTSITQPGVSLDSADGRAAALDTIAHEFFHGWNVERIRPAGIEPFDFTRENVTCCLWLGEGFTQYYGDLLLVRAGFSATPPVASAARLVNAPGRRVRTAVQMSEYAPFADRAVTSDVTDQDRTYLSYYWDGEALALALDLSLRETTGGRLTLDDYMRRLWTDFGAPADARPGYVARPYTLADLRAELAALTGDRAFADTFFDRYVEGHDAPDYAALLAPAGYVVRPAAPGRSWLGDVQLTETTGGLLVGITAGGGTSPVPFDTPLYTAGVDEGDLITAIDGRPATRAAWTALGRRPAGTSVALTVRRRDGRTVAVSAVLEADPSAEVVSKEAAGLGVTAAERAFRQAWLGSRGN
jgi:predicted metalloprotease with PDZ domain